MEEKYLEDIQTFYDEKIKFLSKKEKYESCADCSKTKVFKESPKKLVFSCGGSNDCGNQIVITISETLEYDKEIDKLKKIISQTYNYDEIKNHLDTKDEKRGIYLPEETKGVKEAIKNLEELNYENNMKWKEKKIQEFYDNRVKKTKRMKTLLKQVKKEVINEKIRELRREYITLNEELKNEYSEINEMISNVNHYLVVKPGKSTIENNNFGGINLKKKKKPKKEKEPTKEKEPKKEKKKELKKEKVEEVEEVEEVQEVEEVEEESDIEGPSEESDIEESEEESDIEEPEEESDIEGSSEESQQTEENISEEGQLEQSEEEGQEYLDELTDIEKFTKRKDKYDKDEINECEKSITWKELEKIKDPKKYYNYLKKISTNPQYETFNQIYFHAGDELQFEKFGLLKGRLLKYPKQKGGDENKYPIFNGYNIENTYNTFTYMFEKLKKGIYISIKDSKLDVFLPFSNADYINDWSEILKESNPKLVKQIANKRYNLTDPSKWYANNCILRTDNLKYKYQKLIQEGDKTIVPLKYFMIGFCNHLQEKGMKINLDFFFNPRDFPILKKDYLEPYEQIYPDKTLEEKYIHKTYTPILSQCGNTGYHDLMAPTEDDMLRITTNIYPDSCKNPYSKDVNFELDFSKKKPICVFRGSATGCGITSDTNMRLKAAELSQTWMDEGKNILDAKLTGWNRKPKIYDGQLDEIDTQSFNFKIPKRQMNKPPPNFMPLEEQSQHKYILNIDGHVKAFRLGNELRMGSVILLVDSPYTLWFQDKLKEDEHYVRVNKDLSNLEEKINWCIDHEEECDQIAKNGLEFYKKYLSKEGTYNYFQNLISDLSLHRKAPSYKMIKNTLNIIAAYRDPGDGTRKQQLGVFKKQIQAIFKNKINYHLYIIEQEGERDDYNIIDKKLRQPNSKMAKFNLGMIKNIGYVIANDESKEEENPYFVLSDIDLLPSQLLIDDYLKYPDNPIHLANLGTRYNTEGKNKDFLGGVVSFNSKDFESCNGYPNHYWGWGGEDESLKYRLDENNIEITKSEHPIIDLESFTMEEKMSDLRKRKNKENLKWEKASEEKKGENWKKSGLSNINGNYRITEREDIDNLSHIKVYLSINTFKKLSASQEDAAGVGLDILTKDKLFIGKNVRWYNKKDGELTGEILEVEDKKVIIRDSKGRKIKVLISKLKETIPPDIQEERIAEDSSSSEEDEEDEESEKNVIKVGSKVKWERRIGGGFEEETGEVMKISEKTYQICCKKNGKNYFVSKNEKTLTRIE